MSTRSVGKRPQGEKSRCVLVLVLVLVLVCFVLVCVTEGLTSSAPFALLIWARARLWRLTLIAILPLRPVHVEAAAHTERAVEFSILESQCHSGRISSANSREYNFGNSRRKRVTSGRPSHPLGC